MIESRVDLVGPVLRRFDLDDLFDTDPDLAGGHTDVAPFVRALDRDVDAYVLWRRLKLPPDAQPPMHADELCPAPFYEVRDACAGKDVWILTLATSERRGPAKRCGAAWRRARADEVRAARRRWSVRTSALIGRATERPSNPTLGVWASSPFAY
jgi:CRISPR-associated endonuclease/helicase Cas3